jgi:hypothetical protein
MCFYKPLTDYSHVIIISSTPVNVGPHGPVKSFEKEPERLFPLKSKTTVSYIEYDLGFAKSQNNKRLLLAGMFGP